MVLGSRTLALSLRAGLAAATLLAAAPGAQAQWFGRDHGYYGAYERGPWRQYRVERYIYQPPVVYQPPIIDEPLRPREIVAALQARGFEVVSRPVLDDDVATVRVVNPAGRPVRLTIDLYSGRIIDREREVVQPRQQPGPRVVQRAPDQGPTIRRTVPPPEPPAPARVAPVEPPPAVKREPVAPRQATPPQPPRNERIVRPERPAQPAKPPEASVGTGTRTQPRRIEITPPAPLDAPPRAAPKPAEAPINSVPPAPLE